MIVIVAPYSPAGRGSSPHLGAARKIEAVLQILSERNEELVLVNTAHDGTEKAPIRFVETEIAGVPILEVFPPTLVNRRMGKFQNVLSVPDVVSEVLRRGQPSLVWLYNGYAFESRFGRIISKKTGCPVIQEMEDWHFSRFRGLNPKPFLDWFFWRLAQPHITYSFAVNSLLAERIGTLGSQLGLFPGVVADGVAKIADESAPFSKQRDALTVGYFGGLSVEKGADLVLGLCQELTPDYKILVTGCGGLEGRFKGMAEQCRGRLEFHGRVGDAELLELIARCDVLLNPHSPIELMANGIFPFKVIEGIASGRLMISTSLPSSGLEDVLQGVRFIGHSKEELVAAVLGARSTFESTKVAVEAGARHAVRQFSKSAVLAVVDRVCNRGAN